MGNCNQKDQNSVLIQTSSENFENMKKEPKILKATIPISEEIEINEKELEIQKQNEILQA